MYIRFSKGNISSVKQPIRENYVNFNLGYRINIQGAWREKKFIINRSPLDYVITLLQIPPLTPLHPPLGC